MERNTEQAGTLRREGGDACAKQAQQPQRDKIWSECSLEEKIDRLRIVLRVTNERASVGQRIAVEALEMARRHEHASNGAVLVPAADGHNRPMQFIGKAESDQDYIANLLA